MEEALKALKGGGGTPTPEALSEACGLSVPECKALLETLCVDSEEPKQKRRRKEKTEGMAQDAQPKAKAERAPHKKGENKQEDVPPPDSPAPKTPKTGSRREPIEPVEPGPSEPAAPAAPAPSELKASSCFLGQCVKGSFVNTGWGASRLD